MAALVCVLALVLPGCAEQAAGDGGSRDGTKPAAAKTTPKAEKNKAVVRRVEKRSAIPSGTQVRRTTALTKGSRRVLREGQRGVRVTVWRVTTKNGKIVDRTRLRSRVERRPVPSVVLVGTTPANKRGCDFNYSSCVPIAIDVDCEGGSGNGPKYVAGPVEVIVNDIYDLDSDGDGWGCDS